MRYNLTGWRWGKGSGKRKSHLRLVVALPLVTGLLSFGVGVYAYQTGRTDSAALLGSVEAARILTSVPPALWWLVALTVLGTVIGLAIALAFTRQLKMLARRTEFLARRNFSFPVELETDGEVAPLVSAINELLRSVRDYARHSIADGMISFSRAGRVLSINPRAAVALGVDADGVIGGNFRELIPEVPANREILDALVCSFERSEPFDLEDLMWVNTRGQHLRVDLKGTVLAGEEPIISVLIVFDRVHDLEQVQREVSRAHRLLTIGSFAAELAHEIRNPLSSVVGLVELLHDRLPAGDAGHEHLQVLERATGRIERLVDQLLDLVPTEIDDLSRRGLDVLVRDAVAFVQYGELDRADVELTELHADGLPACRVDPDRIGRAIENLLRNAYAHTPAGGRITVTTRAAGPGRVEVEIANTGSYVPPEERERIFRPFVSGRPGGTGLGLAIAQQIAYAHGGTLEVDSAEDSTGDSTGDSRTAFTLRLPAIVDEAARTATPTAGSALVAGVA